MYVLLTSPLFSTLHCFEFICVTIRSVFSKTLDVFVNWVILYEYAMHLELKDALVGRHESYRLPLPPFCAPPLPLTSGRGFSGVFGTFGGGNKIKQ